jgi:hypothetical protein
VRTRRRFLPTYVACLGVARAAVMPVAGPGPCGATGSLTGSTTLVRTYATVGSDTFTRSRG